MNRELFDLYGKTQSAPALQPGDAIVLDNLSLQKSPGAAAAMKEVGAGLLCLPPCSPGLNPIETAFAKLKALIRRAAARTRDAPWQAEGQVCDLFTEEECHTFFKAACHEADQPQHALAGGNALGVTQGAVFPDQTFFFGGTKRFDVSFASSFGAAGFARAKGFFPSAAWLLKPPALPAAPGFAAEGFFA